MERLRQGRLPRKPHGAAAERRADFHGVPLYRLRSAEICSPLRASGLARADGSCCLSGRQRGQASPYAFIRRPANGLHKKSDSGKLRRYAHLYPEAYERQHGPSGRLDAAHLFRRLDRRNAAYRNAHHYGAYLSGKHDRRVVQPCEPRLPACRPGCGGDGRRGLRL